MSDEIKKNVSEFTQENGNANFTQKELIIYLVRRVDELYTKLNVGDGKTASNISKVNILQKVFYLALVLIVGAIGYLFSLHV